MFIQCKTIVAGFLTCTRIPSAVVVALVYVPGPIKPLLVFVLFLGY